MGWTKRVAAVVVPLGLVVGGVAYGVSRHSSGDGAKDLGECRTKVGDLTVVLTDEQARNASLIAAVSVGRGMPAHAATIGLATALQESKLYNLHGGDRDSLGLFQQRPSQGWGTPHQILDPLHATNAFYDALDRVPGYDTLAVTKAAQEVQHSGFPEAYASYEGDARALASALTGYSPAAFSCHLPVPVGQRTQPQLWARLIGSSLTPAFGRGVAVSVATGGHVQVAAPSSARGWAIASYLVARAYRLDISHVSYRGREWSAGSDGGWQRASGGSTAGFVVVG